MNIHRTLLTRALSNINPKFFYHVADNIQMSLTISIEYKDEKLLLAYLKDPDNLKKYTLSELREIAYLVMTHSNLFCNPNNAHENIIDQKN